MKSVGVRPAVGIKFGRWTVIADSGRRAKNGHIYWLCRCECGTEKILIASSLTRRNSTGCGNCHLRKTHCNEGHAIVEWGRTSTGVCRRCVKEKSLQRNYGISYAELLELWKAQDGKCAICGKELKLTGPGEPGWHKGVRMEVDHRHGTWLPKRKTVRGLLCGGRWMGCNRKIGKLDDIAWLEKVLQYLKDPPAQRVLKERKNGNSI